MIPTHDTHMLNFDYSKVRYSLLEKKTIKKNLQNVNAISSVDLLLAKKNILNLRIQAHRPTAT